MSIFDKAACWECHAVVLVKDLENVREGCNIRKLCPKCLPHSKPEALTCPDRPAPPVVDAVFEEAA